MARNLTDADRQNLVSDYVSGKSLQQIARERGVAIRTVHLHVQRAGVSRLRGDGVALRRLQERDAIRDAVISRFIGGQSVKAIAADLGVTNRSKIYKCLADAGISGRTRSEAMRVRMINTDETGRKALTVAANLKRREVGVSESEARRKAKTHQLRMSRVGLLEDEFISMLARRGIRTSPQFAVDKYNIDIMAWPIAVEIHVTTTNPLKITRIQSRIKDLTNRGIHVLYVWIGRDLDLRCDAADYAVAFRNEVQSLPPGIGQYRVIRGTGKFVAASGDNLN